MEAIRQEAEQVLQPSAGNATAGNATASGLVETGSSADLVRNAALNAEHQMLAGQLAALTARAQKYLHDSDKGEK